MYPQGLFTFLKIIRKAAADVIHQNRMSSQTFIWIRKENLHKVAQKLIFKKFPSYVCDKLIGPNFAKTVTRNIGIWHIFMDTPKLLRITIF